MKAAIKIVSFQTLSQEIVSWRSRRRRRRSLIGSWIASLGPLLTATNNNTAKIARRSGSVHTACSFKKKGPLYGCEVSTARIVDPNVTC